MPKRLKSAVHKFNAFDKYDDDYSNDDDDDDSDEDDDDDDVGDEIDLKAFVGNGQSRLTRALPVFHQSYSPKSSS